MNHPNQRHSARSSVDTTLEVVDIESGIDFQAHAVDVSDGGLAFEAPMEPALGAQMYVRVLGGESGPSEFRVLRIKPSQNGFSVAGSCVPA